MSAFLALLSLTAPDFFRGLYAEADSAYGGLIGDTVRKVMRRYGLPDSCEETLKRAFFLHLLIQNNGLLGVGYIWMNERPAYMFKRVGGRWVDLDSIWVKGHSITQRASAVDRIPRIFFGDLLHEDTLPLYLYLSGKDSLFYDTFGWCSELEMAYSTALSWFGITGRVVFYSEIHVASAVSVAGREFLVDNSFPREAGFFYEEWRHKKPYPDDIFWESEVIRLSSWYNKRVRDGISQSAFWEVGPLAEKRIRKRLRLVR